MLCQRCRHLLVRVPKHTSAPLVSTLPRASFHNSLRTYATAAPEAATGGASTAPASKYLHGPSTVPAGTPLKGINYLANKPEIVALPDEEYPDWLWNLVLDHKVAQTTAGGVNIAEMTKKQRKRHMKKVAAIAAEQPKIVPLHEQSIDITPHDTPRATAEETLQAAKDSLDKTTDIKKSAREARRKAIREANFLRGL